MNPRKWVLLMLPITVAFLVGGFAGSIVGIKEFMLLPAIGWAAVIGIIDYNFSIMEKLNWLGWIGRIVLIMTSAVITATIGDHIIFADTIAEEIEKRAGGNPESVRLDQMVNQKTIDWENAQKAVRSSQDELNKIDSEIKRLNSEITYEINHGGCYAKCEEKKTLLTQTRLDKEGLVANREYLVKREESAKEELDKAKETYEGQLTKLKKSHNIILEIQVLYEKIFESAASMIIFVLLSLMVICIETLPLLLKSGITTYQVKKEKEMFEAKKLAKKNAAESKRIKDLDAYKRQIIWNNKF